MQMQEVTASLGSGLAEQANPRNLILGICKIEEPADSSLVADLAGRCGWRDFREFGAEFPKPYKRGLPTPHPHIPVQAMEGLE